MFAHILVASGGAESRSAAAVVAELAAGCSAPVTVKVLHVTEVEYEIPGPETSGTDVDPDARVHLAALVAELRQAGVDVTGEVRPARYEEVSDDIIAEAREMGAGLIVVGTRGRGDLKAWIAGSVSHAIIRRSGLPVIVVPAPRDGE